jgi:hypothetical protein
MGNKKVWLVIGLLLVVTLSACGVFEKRYTVTYFFAMPKGSAQITWQKEDGTEETNEVYFYDTDYRIREVKMKSGTVAKSTITFLGDTPGVVSCDIFFIDDDNNAISLISDDDSIGIDTKTCTATIP